MSPCCQPPGVPIPFGARPTTGPAFDPARNTAPQFRLWPEWLRELREAAYRASREGRDGRLTP